MFYKSGTITGFFVNIQLLLCPLIVRLVSDCQFLVVAEPSNREVGDDPKDDIDDGADDDPVRMMKSVKMIRMEQRLESLNSCGKAERKQEDQGGNGSNH